MKDFRKVWFAGSLAGLMRWFDALAFSVYVLDTTGSALMVSFVLFFRMLPMFMFGAVIGAYAETVDRKKLLHICLVLLSLVYVVFFLLAWSEMLQFWHIAAGIFLSGIYAALDMPVRRTMIAEIAGIEHTSTAMGLDSLSFNLTRMLGPFLAGWIFERYGLQGTLLTGIVVFLTASVMMHGVNYASLPALVNRPSIILSILNGFHYARQNKTIKATLVVTIIMNLFGFSVVSMIPVFAREVLGLSAFPTGILMSAEGLGAFAGSLAIAFCVTSSRSQQLFYYGAVVYVGCIVCFSLSIWFGLSFSLLLIGGFGVSGFAAMQSALVIMSSPVEMRNRVMGVLAMCIGFSPLGVLLIGILADTFGVTLAVQITSATCLVCLVICGFCWPEMLRKLNRNEA